MTTKQQDDNLTEFIKCEHCAHVFDHDSSAYGAIHCPACAGKITDASPNINPDALADFVAALNTKFNGVGYTFLVERPGVRYTRIVQTAPGHRSVFCFVDADGNIYKAAGWKGPAKGVRSTLATVELSKVDPYGSWLYR